MTNPKKDLDRLQREIDDARTEADQAFKGESPKPVLYRTQNLGLYSEQQQKLCHSKHEMVTE